MRYNGYDTKLLVVDPDNSTFYESNTRNDRHYECDASSHIEGIGRDNIGDVRPYLDQLKGWIAR